MYLEQDLLEVGQPDRTTLLRHAIAEVVEAAALAVVTVPVSLGRSRTEGLRTSAGGKRLLDFPNRRVGPVPRSLKSPPVAVL